MFFRYLYKKVFLMKIFLKVVFEKVFLKYYLLRKDYMIILECVSNISKRSLG